MKFISKNQGYLEAEQWNKNGDHSLDESKVINEGKPSEYLSEGKFIRYFDHPDVPGDSLCTNCGKPMFKHGWIDPAMFKTNNDDGPAICPSDYIVRTPDGKSHFRVPKEVFEQLYSRVPELNPMEALFAFMSWLTTREEAVTFSSNHDAAPAVELIAKFAEKNYLGEITSRWPENMVSVKEPKKLVEEKQSGSDLIVSERKRQIEEEGYTLEKDLLYNPGILFQAGRCYEYNALGRQDFAPNMAPKLWPFKDKYWKPKNTLSSLIKAGALYLAERDALQHRKTNQSIDIILSEKLMQDLNLSIDNVILLIDMTLADGSKIQK